MPEHQLKREVRAYIDTASPLFKEGQRAKMDAARIADSDDFHPSELTLAHLRHELPLAQQRALVADALPVQPHPALIDHPHRFGCACSKSHPFENLGEQRRLTVECDRMLRNILGDLTLLEARLEVGQRLIRSSTIMEPGHDFLSKTDLDV